MPAHPVVLRQRALDALERGKSIDAVAEVLDLHPATVRTWRREAAAGKTRPAVGGRRPVPVKLTPADVQKVLDEVERRPGVTLRELVALIGHKVVQSTLSRLLTRRGYRYKKSRWQPASRSVPMSSANALAFDPRPGLPGDLA